MRAGLATGMSPVAVRDTLSLPQILGILAEQERRDAERDLAQLELVNAAVAPLAAKENAKLFDGLATRLRRIITADPASSAARALFAKLKAKAKRG